MGCCLTGGDAEKGTDGRNRPSGGDSSSIITLLMIWSADLNRWSGPTKVFNMYVKACNRMVDGVKKRILHLTLHCDLLCVFYQRRQAHVYASNWLSLTSPLKSLKATQTWRGVRCSVPQRLLSRVIPVAVIGVRSASARRELSGRVRVPAWKQRAEEGE